MDIDVRKLWKEIPREEKRAIREKIFHSTPKTFTSDPPELILVSYCRVKVEDLVGALKFNPKGPINQDNYKKAIHLYRLNPSGSKRYLEKNRMKIIFEHPDWVLIEDEKVLLDFKNMKPKIPKAAPSCPLQERFVAALCEYAITRHKETGTRFTRYITEHEVCKKIYMETAYNLWERCWYCNKSIRHVEFIPKRTFTEPVGLNKNVQLYWKYLRREREELLTLFKDLSVLKTWPVEDRKFITAVIHDYVIGKHLYWRFDFGETVNDYKSFAKLFITFFDQSIVKEAWPEKRLQSFRWWRFSAFRHLSVRDVIDQGNLHMVGCVVQQSERNAYDFLKISSISEILNLYELCPRKLSKLTHYLERSQPETFKKLLEEGYLHGVKYKYERSEYDTNMEKMMKSFNTRSWPISRTIISMADGLIPERALQSVIAEMEKKLSSPPSISKEFLSYFGSIEATDWSVQDFANIPITMLMDSHSLCHFVVWVLWKEVKAKRFNSNQWTQFLLTALTFYTAENK